MALWQGKQVPFCIGALSETQKSDFEQSRNPNQLSFAITSPRHIAIRPNPSPTWTKQRATYSVCSDVTVMRNGQV